MERLIAARPPLGSRREVLPENGLMSDRLAVGIPRTNILPRWLTLAPPIGHMLISRPITLRQGSILSANFPREAYAWRMQIRLAVTLGREPTILGGILTIILVKLIPIAYREVYLSSKPVAVRRSVEIRLPSQT